MKIFSMFGDILVNDQATKAFNKIDKQTNKIGKKFTKFIGIAGKLGVGVAAGATTAVGGLLALTDSAGDFEAELNNVGTLLDGDVAAKLDQFGKDVKQLSLDANLNTNLLTDGLYQVVSAVGDTADSMDILEVAAKGAKAGNATVTDSVNLLSAVMKGYGDVSTESAQKASDLAFQTVKLGQTTFPELAASMGKVIPLAATLKISQEELFGASATLTGVTGNTAEVMTQLRAIMQGTLKPSKEMTATLDKMGFKTGAAAVESLGLQGTLAGLKEAVGGNEVEFSNLFGSVEASTAALALTGTQAENFISKTAAMQEATGAANKAFEQQNQGINALKEQIKNYVNVIGINIGEKLLPIVNKMLKWFVDKMPIIMTTIDRLSAITVTAVDIISSVINFLIGVFDELKENNSDTITEITDNFKEGFKFIVDFAKEFWKVIKAFWDENGQEIWESTKETFKAIMEAITPVLNFIMSGVQEFWTIISDLWKRKGSDILNAAKDTFFAIMDVIQFVIKLVTKLWQTYSDDLLVIWNMAKNNLKAAFELLSTILINVFKIMTSLLKGDFEGLEKALGSIVDAIFKYLKTIFTNIKDTIVTIWSNSKDETIALAKLLSEKLFDIFTSIAAFVIDSFVNLWKESKKHFTNFIDSIVNWFKNDGVPKMVEAGKNLALGISEGIKSKIEDIVNGAKELGSKIISTIKSKLKIQSPSKVMEEIGNFIGLGLEKGIANSESSLLNQVAMTNDKLLNGFGGDASLGIQAQSNRFTQPNITNKENKELNVSESKGGIVQHITINSPKELDAGEVARQTKKASQQLVLA